MFVGLLFSYVLIVPFVHGNTLNKAEGTTNLTSPVLTPIPHNAHKKASNITVPSEGGAILSNTPALSLPKENASIPMISAKEISSNKVKARKGAIFNSSNDIEDVNLGIKENDSKSNDTQPIVKTNVNAMQNNTKIVFNATDSSTPVNKTHIHKPPILSAEAIAKTDEMNNDPVVDDVDERTVKIHKISSNGHPGMIMPIVITILVVPMFAVIGYMGLKRGQEAWKNRHYKRMDFLLDGMYND